MCETVYTYETFDRVFLIIVGIFTLFLILQLLRRGKPHSVVDAPPANAFEAMNRMLSFGGRTSSGGGSSVQAAITWIVVSAWVVGIVWVLFSRLEFAASVRDPDRAVTLRGAVIVLDDDGKHVRMCVSDWCARLLHHSLAPGERAPWAPRAATISVGDEVEVTLVDGKLAALAVCDQS